MTWPAIAIREARPEDATVCVALLRALPDWFGIEAAIEHYADEIPHLQTFLARVEGEVSGFISLAYHNSSTAEIYLLAVCQERHRQGIGTALVSRVEQEARDRGHQLFEVKTLGPSHPSEHYARTRAFYRKCGFLPLEELHDLWPGNPCLIMVKPLR